MNTFYFILLVIVAGLSSLATYYVPQIKRVIIQRNRAKKRKLETLISAEIAKQLKEIIND
jgi:hypothetical protein